MKGKRSEHESAGEIGNRPYDDIPRQGTHRGKAFDDELTTNVRAQEAPRPHEPSKRTHHVHLLLKSSSRDAYRLQVVPADVQAAPDGDVEDGDFEDGDFEVIARVPASGDVEGLYARIPDTALYAVFDHTGSGDVHQAPEGRLSGDWTSGAKFDRVTIFREEDAARAFADARREEASGERSRP